ncbi:MAG: GDP-mannose 4,6-dehydratase [Thermoleophilaceae bacterium]|nr:GDP-mannose 4,6-dehydratase [Thermoleophilaceae bacterium]
MGRTLVTGSAGFIASHLVEALVADGAEVRALAHYNARDDLGMLADIDPAVLSEVEVVRGDITDPHQMRRITAGCEQVMNLAALIGIPYSYVAPSAYVEANIRGTLNLLEAAREEGVECFLQTSTSEIYGSAQYVPIDEKHPVHPQSPYAATKVASDQLALSYQRSFGTPATVVRPFNTYGPRQSARAVIPTILSQLFAGGSVKLGNLDARRDLTLAADTAQGFLAIAGADTVGEVLNLGTGEDHSIQEIFDLCVRVTGRQPELMTDETRVRPPDSEVDRLLSDPTRVRELTGWTHQHDLESGLELTAAWIERNLEQYRPEQYTV